MKKLHKTAREMLDETHSQGRLCKKDLTRRWNCSPRTVDREVRRYNLVPADFKGIMPIYDLNDVVKLEMQRREKGLARTGYVTSQKIITVKQAKAYARKRGGK